MTSQVEPLRCPGCGIDMNHHADKLTDPRNGEGDQIDPVLGGLIEEVHTCPGCGEVRTRRRGGIS